MSYREENGQVILTMSKKDYDKLLLIFGYGLAAASTIDSLNMRWMVELANRINEGNPQYTPYR